MAEARTDDAAEVSRASCLCSDSVDYLAPFESFRAFAIRNGVVYRGRIRAEYAGDREALGGILSRGGEFTLEELDGRLYATIRAFRRRPKRRLWLHITLLVLTIITTVGAGAEMTQTHPEELALIPFNFVVDALTDMTMGAWGRIADSLWPEFARAMVSGIPFAAALLFVLLSHEMGHYLMARRYGADATLPFLLPAPFFFGTVGAIIRMRSPMVHRRALFDVGAAGPLAGLAASLIVCVVGLRMSQYVPVSAEPHLPFELGRSALLAGLERLVMGAAPPMSRVELSPVAIAGWFGLFLTFLNLMPLGQLDGGHVWYALVGRWQRWVGWTAFTALLGMGAVYRYGLWVFVAVLALVVVRVKHPPVMEEWVPLGRWRVAVGVLVIVFFVLLFLPEPIAVMGE